MSRQSVAPGRNLSLTEELERLEQSITLTLQEIDSNFSKAHRIVTTSILPIVEQYAQHSQDVWEGSKFWKQFFEASANVSLSGYEEPALDEDATYAATTEHESSSLATPPRTSRGGDHADESTGLGQDGDESSLMLDSPSNATGVHSTPRLLSSGKKALRSPPPSRQRTTNLPSRPRFTEDDEPSTPRPHAAMDSDAGSSPFEPPSAFQPSTTRRTNNDPLLHRVLDKTYRVAATPHSTRRVRGPQQVAAAAGATPSVGREKTFNFDSSPMSSPAIAPPQLRSDLFSPARAPRTPRSPAPAARVTSTGKPVSFPSASKAKTLRTPALWDSDSGSSDGEFDMSPPKTMQFAVPQGRIVATPAREASRRIVADLLASAGGGWEDEEGTEDLEAPSPTVVRQIEEDDTF
ncbi:hypothetical protein K461DRAFT_292753 [Myriangium duriaei CBS 260.36]|uniref:DASH complex subunit ASK1 n=1 Tax=Myriangium duriaei CBS 260.36 TaxID=1168546 RepID=A0A9P4J6G5_9PEZI|nr:hypothetical protein K461DRAFT_292753 [Myriangium duriaei CBS 260.36]